MEKKTIKSEILNVTIIETCTLLNKYERSNWVLNYNWFFPTFLYYRSTTEDSTIRDNCVRGHCGHF